MEQFLSVKVEIKGSIILQKQKKKKPLCKHDCTFYEKYAENLILNTAIHYTMQVVNKSYKEICTIYALKYVYIREKTELL